MTELEEVGNYMEREQSSKVQIRKIADKLGLSVSTVSVVLNGRGDRVRISKRHRSACRMRPGK